MNSWHISCILDYSQPGKDEKRNYVIDEDYKAEDLDLDQAGDLVEILVAKKKLELEAMGFEVSQRRWRVIEILRTD